MMAAPSIGPRKVIPAPQEGHDRDLERKGPEHHVGENRIVDHNEKNTCDAGKEAGNHDRDELMSSYIHADRLASYRIVPNSLKNTPKRCVENPVHDEQGEGSPRSR